MILDALGELLGLVYRPADVEDVPVVRGAAAAATLARGAPFDVVSWNIQYAAGRTRRFFYDGGDAVAVPPEEVRENVAKIAAVFADADVVLLQEIDRDSRRTGRIDELPPLAAPFASLASTPYHRCRFVPVPPADPLGRTEMHLAVLSRFQLGHARRLALPLLRESAIRRALNLKRAVLTAELPCGDRSIAIAVTHLSAFSRGDGTLDRQVAVLAGWMDGCARRSQPFVLAGDLNLLPPGDDPTRLPDARDYVDRENPILPLFERFRSVIPRDRLLDPAVRTYQRWQGAPDRVLDYMFVSEDIEVLRAAVVASDLSDHLPLRATLRLP